MTWSSRCSASADRPAAASASPAMRSPAAPRRGAPGARRQSRRPGEGLVGGAAPHRQLGLEDPDRPSVPAAGLHAVGAVGVAGLLQVLAGRLVGAANQVNLRERVEDRAGRLVELNGLRTSRARCSICSARSSSPSRTKICPSVASAIASPRPGLSFSCSATLRSASASACSWRCCDHRDVRLVAADDGQDVVGLDHRGQPFGLAEGGRGLVEPSGLRQDHARQRVDEREMPPVAGGVQRRRRLRDVLAHDGGVADLLVAEPEFVVGEADGPGVVRQLGVLQRAAQQRDGARLIAAGERDAAVQPPQRRQLRRRQRVAHRVGRAAEHGAGLAEVVAEQPRFGQRAPEGQLVLAREAGARRACARISIASPPCPRSRAARARASAGRNAMLTTTGSIRRTFAPGAIDGARFLGRGCGAAAAHLGDNSGTR